MAKQVHQQACKTQIPPYGLTQRHRRPQFQLSQRDTAPNSDCPLSLARSCRVAPVHWRVHRGSNAAAVTSVSLSSPKWEKTCLDSSRTHIQNFMPLSFYAAEKSATVQTKNQANKCVSRLARCKSHHTYGLKQRRRPQFQLHAPASSWKYIQWPHTSRKVMPPPWLPASQSSPKGRRSVRIVGQHACKISHAFFPLLRNL